LRCGHWCARLTVSQGPLLQLQAAIDCRPIGSKLLRRGARAASNASLCLRSRQSSGSSGFGVVKRGGHVSCLSVSETTRALQKDKRQAGDASPGAQSISARPCRGGPLQFHPRHRLCRQSRGGAALTPAPSVAAVAGLGAKYLQRLSGGQGLGSPGEFRCVVWMGPVVMRLSRLRPSGQQTGGTAES